MKRKRPSKEIRALARRAADVAGRAPLDGLDAARAVMAATIYVSVRAGMSREEIIDWLRRLALELEDPDEAFCAQVREALRKQLASSQPQEH